MKLRLGDKISSALFGKTRQAILGLLYSRPAESFYLRQIVRTLNLGMGAVQRELKNLEEAGIILKKRSGNQIHYSANTDNPIFQELKNMVFKTVGLASVLRNALERHKGKIDFAFIYGSIAKGEETPNSDLDLMIIGDITLMELAASVFPLREAFEREVNPVIYSLREFKDKLLRKNNFVLQVLHEPKFFLMGSEDEFRSLGEGQVNKASQSDSE